MNKASPPLLKIIKLFLLSIISLCSYTLWVQLNAPVILTINNENIKQTPVVDNEISSEESKNDIKEISDYSEIIERPLFFENRQPFVYVEPEKPSKQQKKKKQVKPKKTEQLSLNAVIITAGKKLAIIQTGKEKTLQRVQLGEAIEGWTLESVEPRVILLSKGNQTKELQLEIKSSPFKNKLKARSAKTAINNKTTQKNDNLTEKTDNNIETTDKKSN